MKRAMAMVVLLSVYMEYGCRKNNELVTQDLHVVMLNAVNQLRETGCRCGTVYMPPAPDLVWNDTLEKAAAGHLSDMYRNNYFSHIGLDGSAPVQRAQELGYTGDYVGENIARGYNSVEDVMNGFLNSQDHCQAMMDTLYKEMGAARLNDEWDQEFGRKN